MRVVEIFTSGLVPTNCGIGWHELGHDDRWRHKCLGALGTPHITADAGHD
jgi:hypothetical protein